MRCFWLEYLTTAEMQIRTKMSLKGDFVAVQNL